jgi:hypothetical protein
MGHTLSNKNINVIFLKLAALAFTLHNYKNRPAFFLKAIRKFTNFESGCNYT